jgi:hypothetical protein
MLRIIPRSWFKRSNPAYRAHAEQVDALQAHWRTWLAKAIARVVSDDAIDASSAVARLQGLSPAQLLELDRVLRYGWWDLSEGLDEPGRVPLVAIDARRPEDDAYLFVASAHPNGFVREQAISAFRHYPGRLAMASALIRCDDWVGKVRAAASERLVHLVGESSGIEMMEWLPLMLLLRRRHRFGEGVWSTVIEPKLLEPASREARWAATAVKPAPARGFAFQLVLRADPDRAEAALLAAVSDDHPGIALWAIEQAIEAPGGSARRDVLERAALHKRASIRAHALRLRFQRDPAGSEALLRQAIFDPARAPRNAAAYLLRTAFQRSALADWREALDEKESRREEVALAALSEHGEACDHDRLAPYLTHSKPRLRALALRALARVGSDDLREHLVKALSDSSVRVVKQAMGLIRHRGEAMGRSWLEQGYVRSSDARMRVVYVRAARLLPQWENLDVLLAWADQADEDTFVAIAQQLDRWLGLQNRRFAPLTEGMRGSLAAHLAAASVSRPGYEWKRLEDVLWLP